MRLETKVALAFAACAYGVLLGWVARRLGRSVRPWIIGGIAAGPFALPILLFAGPLQEDSRPVRRWLVVGTVLLATVGGTLGGAWLFVDGRGLQPSRAVRVKGRRVVREPDGPTAYAVATIAEEMFLAVGAGLGGAFGLVVSPRAAVLAEMALRRFAPSKRNAADKSTS